MPDAPPRHLILYGSLKQGHPAHAELRLAERLRFIRPASFPGRLYDLGDYPALALGGPGQAHGELYEILDPAVLPELDAFEMIDPDRPEPFDAESGRGSLYRRETLQLAGLAAFVYVFNAPTGWRPPGPAIASGRWPAGGRAG